MSSPDRLNDIEVLNPESNNNSNYNNRPRENNISSSSISPEDGMIADMINILELDANACDSRMLVNQLIVNGRQALSRYEDDIVLGIYNTQMNKDGSQLLTLLKNYIEYQWQSHTDDWFKIFLHEQKTKSPALYDRILTRTAEYGSKYVKDFPSLLLVVQFLFDFTDQELEDKSKFETIWKTLVLEGRRSLSKFSEDLAQSVIKEQSETDQSALSLALGESYQQPLSTLLDINDPDLIEIALNCLVKYGWTEGLNYNDVTYKFSPKKHRELIERLKKYLKDNNLEIPDSTDNTQQTTDTSNLMNSSMTPSDKTKSTSTTPKSSHPNSINPPPTTSTLKNNSDDADFFDTLSTMASFTLDNSTNQGQDERTIITMCTDGYAKWQLANLVQAGELMFINQKFPAVIKNIVAVYDRERNFTEFLDKCLQTMMFLLKRHQNLEDFATKLFFNYFDLDQSSTFSTLNLRMMKDILLLKSDFSLSRMLISLLSKRNHVPFLQPSLANNSDYRFVPDIIHVWDYYTPTLLSFGIDQCEGKSMLLNKIFMSSFEQTSSSIYFQETIDIDFGYNFNPHRSINIADTHGSMTIKLLQKIHDLFDGFIIHINYEYINKNFEIVKSFLSIASQQSRYCLLLIRDVPDNQCSKELPVKFPSSIQKFILPNISDPNKAQNQRSILKLYQKIFDAEPPKLQHEKKYTQTLLKNLFNPQFKEQLQEISQVIQPLKERLIFALQNENVVSDSFPIYIIYAQLCGLNLKLASFNFYGSENDNDVFDVHEKINELNRILNTKGKKTGIIFDLFVQILQSPNMLTCLDVLATDLKDERSRLVPLSEMSKQLPVNKSLSLEVLWRNAMICGIQQSDQLQNFLYQQYGEYIRAGYPFEIVDGDNFYFHYNFLCYALSLFHEKKILVISVIGPQNSGKSTLLNYMFGTLFDVRDGRCTRGIYGSFVKSNRPDFDYIMLIDTEGLLGVEREDLQYDRRIVLFCLAVSHLVIVNTAGEFNVPFQRMLSLCTDSLRQMGVTRIFQPTVRFILNQRADLSSENNREAINRIVSDLNKTGPTVHIKTESFHTLPSAFKKGSNLASDTNKARPVNTEADFLERVQLLCGELIQAAESVLNRSTEISDPIQWLKSSFTIFETLQKFSDLTFFQDINEREQDDKVREHIRKKLTEIFSSTYRNQLIQDSIKLNEKEIDRMFDVKQEQIQTVVQQDLENVLKLLKASDTIRTRSKQFLNTQIISAFDALRTTSKVANEREKVKLLVRDGEGDLRQLIDDTINSGNLMSSESASMKFETMFQNSVEHIQHKFIQNDFAHNALIYIYTNYNIYEREGLPDYQHISNHLSVLVHFNESQLAVHDLQDEFILRFTKLAYKEHQPIEIRPFINDGINIYSFEQIDSLVYLNKEVCYDKFIEYLKKNYSHFVQQQAQAHLQNASKGSVRQFFKDMLSKLRINNQKNKNSPSQTIIYTTKFLQEVRQKISSQKPTVNAAMIDETNMYLRVSELIREIIQTIFKEMKGTEENETRLIQTDLIQKIVGLINTLIINVDNELRPFCLSLSRQLKSIFHVCGILLLTAFYFYEQKTHFQQTVEELHLKKDHMKDYFVRMVVSDSSADANYALNLVKQFLEHTIECFKVDCQQSIKTQLQDYDFLNRKWMQERCDGQLLTNNDMKWLMNYVENPTKIIEEEFKQLWQNILRTINQKLIEIKSNYNSVIVEFFFCLQGVFDALKPFRCSSATLVADIFQSLNGNDLNVNENLTQKKRCMTVLLRRYLSGESTPLTIDIKRIISGASANTQNVEIKTYKVKKEAFDVFKLLANQRPPSALLKAITREISAAYDRISIDNFAAFLQNVLNEQANLLQKFSELKTDFNSMDKEDTYARLLDKVRGCPNLCPCCNRPCD
ncbi:unnamed protein product, partial [Rotaria sp. Silwood2]